MKIKKFEFPSFEKWWDNYYTKPYQNNFKTQIGKHTVEVSEVGMWLYGDLYHSNCCLNAKPREEVKEWYDQSIKELNKFWEKYVRETYLED